MKNFMLPKNSILRENLSETQSSPNPKPRSSPSSSRKQRSSKENAPPADPNTLHEPPSTAAKPPLSGGKSRPHLPPRPPSSLVQNPLKRKLNMENLGENGGGGGSDTGVKVIVRMRPPNKNEEEGDAIVQKVSPDSLTVLGHTFTFDSVADTNSTQQEIFHLVGAPLVENCLAGFNSSIFAYGQTGSGKTYTMWGPANALLERNIANSQQGLTPRVFEQLFKRIEEEQVKHADKQLKYQCRCSFLEIYNEQITDLLDPAQRNLQLREDVKSGVYVENLTEDVVCTLEDVTRILVKGFSNRKIGATSLNAESSRSHSVFTCVVESRCKSASDGLSSIRVSRINLVDLAGSERQKLTGTAGERLKEAGNINRSLSQLGNLINILAEVSQSGKQRHIPYRDSRLTFLLQESLGGNAKLAMICAISPASSCKSETFSTLRFAQRAKAIKNKAVVNEETQDDVNVLREVIRQLKDELLRMKENGNPTNPNGGYLTSWNARRSLNLLKMSLSRPRTLPHIEGDSDEEMEIDEEAVERLCVQAGRQIAGFEENNANDLQIVPFEKPNNTDNIVAADSSDEAVLGIQQTNDLSGVSCSGDNVSKEADVNMEDCSDLGVTDRKCSDSQVLKRKPEGQIDVDTESVDRGSEIVPVEPPPHESPTGAASPVLPSDIAITPSGVPPVLKSPPPSVSPRVNTSRKSLKTSSLLSASQKDLSDEKCSKADLKADSSRAPSTRASKNCRASTEHLAESLHRGLQIIDSHRQSSALRRSSFRFSYKPVELKSVLPIEKVDVGVQTLPEPEEDSLQYICGDCKNRIIDSENKETSEHSDMQLVPIDGSQSKKQVPKAVEKVLAGAIRREMALEEICSKQTSEISQLNRLVQQYKHERECNATIEQSREDKIRRLEGLMDGVLPTEEFMEDELLSLTNEHKLLKAKYDNHPEVLRTRIELNRVQDELEGYRNFFDMGERDVLVEEIHHLRSQLKYYVESSSPDAAKIRSSVLRLTYSVDPVPLSTIPESTEESLEDKVERETASTISESTEDKAEQETAPTIPESTEESAEDKFEQERRRWTEVESNWISLAEELKTELESSRCLVEKQKWELESEKKCSEELKEAMQMAMQGHARILEQYADLQENHFALLARHRKMQEGIDDVKRAAAKAGVKGAESRFINSLAAEISALRAEKEKEKRYLMDENKGLQAQLRDTAEAVQAAGELLVRLKEADEAASIAEKRALEAEREAEKAYQQVDDLKKEHDREISSLSQLLAASRLPQEALRPVSDAVKYDATECCLSAGDDKWREEFEQIYRAEEDTELSKLSEPSSWYSGYDRCNI